MTKPKRKIGYEELVIVFTMQESENGLTMKEIHEKANMLKVYSSLLSSVDEGRTVAYEDENGEIKFLDKKKFEKLRQ